MGQTSLVYKGVKYDSDEEVFISMWLQELKDAGYIVLYYKSDEPIPLTDGLVFEYQVETQLKTKVRVDNKKKVWLNPSEYTPDFLVRFTQKGMNRFVNQWHRMKESKDAFYPGRLFLTNNPNDFCYFEVKPAFDQNNMTRTFGNNQKFIWKIHQIFINLLEPMELFQKTFVPQEVMPYFTYSVNPSSGKNKGKKFKGDFKYDWKPKTLSEYIKL